MKNLQELLTYLHASQIRLWLEDDRLRVSAPQGVLTEEVRSQLTFYKSELLLLLEKQAMQHIPAVPRTGKEPLSYSQQRLWFLQLLEENSAYSMPAILHLQGELQLTALQQAVDTIVARHESLRTNFVEEAGEIYQKIRPSAAVSIPCIELFPNTPDEQMASVLSLADDEIRRPFDLAEGPLLRVLLIRILPTAQTAGSPCEHYLVFNMHHIISDGVSIALLIEEFSALYSAAVSGETATLPSLPIQYADYAVWQRKWLQGRLLEQQAAYWQEELSSAPPLLELPTDRPRPAQQTFRGKTIDFKIDREMTRKINLFSQQHNGTPFMVLLSAFALLLYRYSNQSDILIGTPIAGRGQPEVERLIGLFINTLVMRASFDENLTGQALVEQVRQTALDAYANQDLPFERLIDLLQLERNRSYNPVFQVMFAMQMANPEQLELPGLTLRPLDLETDMAKFDLNLMMGESTSGLLGSLEYNSDLFDEATAQQLVRHFQNLLAAMIEQPTAKVATLPMLDPTERHQQLVAWNATSADYPHTQCLHQLFEAQVQRTPDACALVDAGSGVELTYGELNARANQVAHQLLALGAKPDDLIGLCVERTPNLLIGLLGILKAGAAYVPLDPAFPKSRLELMIADAAPAILVTEHHFADEFAQIAIAVLYLDNALDPEGEIAQQPIHNPVNVVKPHNLAYVIYTSGSTGKPKGVELQHQSVVNFLCSMQRAPGLCAADRLLAVTTISFDIAVLELYLPLITGATVILANEEMSADPEQLMRFLPAATVMQATPATWRMLLLANWPGQPNLRMLVGGEALPTNLAETLLPRGLELWNLYGPTETTVWSSLHKVEAATATADGAEGGAVSIGRPINNTQLYILDLHQQPVPVGVPGELYIGGDGLARGYRHLPEMTAQKFLPNPFAAGRVYRTGDWVRHRRDGAIEYLGRMDNQVKIRGFRIELGEIESVLAQHPQINQAVVVAQTDSSGGKRLVAFLMTEEPMPAGDELRNFLRDRLPEYMLPSTFVSLDGFPLTPNGKVDRRSLMLMTVAAAELSTPYVAPATPLEEELVAIWAEVLKLDPYKVGTRHNFFDLGGHSLLAIQVLARVRAAFQVELPIRDLMDNPTIAGVAAAIEPMQQLAALFSGVPDEVGANRESIEI